MSNLERRKVITVDGPAGSGKTTLSLALAEKLGWVHLNSGSIYRAAAYCVMKEGAADFKDWEDIKGIFNKNSICLELDGSKSVVLLNGENIEALIRTPEVSELTSRIAVIPQLRVALRRIQREAFQGRNLVAEGRDMGTVIFPDADLKFFLQVDEKIRIERRLKQLSKDSKDVVDEGDIAKEIIERDLRDRTRKASPLAPAPDAVIVDNNSKTLTEAVKTMYDVVLERGLA